MENYQNDHEKAVFSVVDALWDATWPEGHGDGPGLDRDSWEQLRSRLTQAMEGLVKMKRTGSAGREARSGGLEVFHIGPASIGVVEREGRFYSAQL